MKCPYCDVEMIPGFLKYHMERAKTQAQHTSRRKGKYALHLEVPMLSPHHIESNCCPKCKKIMIDASDYENNLD